MDWTLCVLLMSISYVTSSNLHPRVTVNQGITRLIFEDKNISLVKLVSTGNKTLWAAGEKVLYSIRPPQDFGPHQVNVYLCNNESQDADSSHCPNKISLLQEGADGQFLFICRSNGGNTQCCNLTSSYSLIDCFMLENYEPDIKEPSLLVGNVLYFTKPDQGLYRINYNINDKIWSQTIQAEQSYLKLIAGKGPHGDKVYCFFTEKKKSKDGKSEEWIPQVSQSCMNDRGGSKSQLQSSWTSMIYTRLSCGSEFTRMVDVATLDTDDDTKIYALFRNYWNMSSVCVYSMTEISRIFSSSDFNSKVPFSHRPGTCVPDSTSLSMEVLTFMKDRPEMKDLVMPQNDPLVFPHRHYTHIQVDRVRGHNVLLLSLESGGVHKVLEKPVFVIAEYLPFKHGTNITSMLLDASERRLYVSSSKEVIQIDLQTCHVYGDECDDCRLSRDPYCGWEGLKCTSEAKKPVQDIRHCNEPEAAPSKSESSGELTVISPSSRHFLLCPITSHHATYHWYHGETREECKHSEQGCLYLIYSMNTTHEGEYRCESSEESYTRTVSQYKLRMSQSDGVCLSPALLLTLTASLILLLTF